MVETAERTMVPAGRGVALKQFAAPKKSRH